MTLRYLAFLRKNESVCAKQTSFKKVNPDLLAALFIFFLTGIALLCEDPLMKLWLGACSFFVGYLLAMAFSLKAKRRYLKEIFVSQKHREQVEKKLGRSVFTAILGAVCSGAGLFVSLFASRELAPAIPVFRLAVGLCFFMVVADFCLAVWVIFQKGKV